MRTKSQAEIGEIARLKSLYHDAVNRKFDSPDAQDSPNDNETQKRAKKAIRMANEAREREN